MPPKKIRIVTHNSRFHADDVFGVATLMLFLGKENIEVVRSREQSVIDSGEYVLDVGLVYDSDKNRFDHHQQGGAGIRDNGLPYASFGLVWKKFGTELCKSEKIARRIEDLLVRVIDASDNGVDIWESKYEGVFPYEIQNAINVMNPTHLEGDDLTDEQDRAFLETVEWVTVLMKREIVRRTYECDVLDKIEEIYQSASRKDLIVFEEGQVWNRELVTEGLQRYPEPLFVVRPYSLDESPEWQLVAVVKKPFQMELRKKLPDSWGGKHDGELAKVTGVSDARFCHRGLFMAIAKSKEGALKLAELALSS